MRKIILGGQEYPATFTTWATNEFYKLSGLNLYEHGELAKVFKSSNGEKIVPSDFENVAKFAYCAMAAGCMPEDADENWKPSFTWQGVMNKFSLKDSDIYAQLVAVYNDQEVDIVMDFVKKNQSAPQTEGQQQNEQLATTTV